MSKSGKGMSQEMYEHITKHLYTLELDLTNGIILNRNAKALTKGYPIVGLAGKMVKQHQVFAVQRWGEACIGMTVNHKNEVKTDNSWDNLELLSYEDNIRARTCIDDWKQPVKATNIDTGETHVFPSQREASRALGLNVGHINNVLSGESKRTGRWTFERVSEVGTA